MFVSKILKSQQSCFFQPDGNLRQVKKDFLDVHGPPPLPPDVGIVPKQLNSDYTLMGPGDWNKMEELKDDYSDSGDSCYSSRVSIDLFFF